MCATVGSSTLIGWKRRSSAASFSRCLRYSSSRRRTDRLQLTTSQHRLEDRRSVDRTFGGAGTDEGVDLVDEQDDVAAGLDLLEDLLQALLEVTAVAGAGDQGTEIEGVELLALDRLGNVVAGDLLGQALDDRGLADTGLADEHRVVLGAA